MESDVSARTLFFKDKFYGVVIKTKGIKNGQTVLELLKIKYGDPQKPSEYEENYEWSNETLMVLYSQDSKTGDAIITYDYMPLKKIVDADVAKKKEEAANKDL